MAITLTKILESERVVTKTTMKSTTGKAVTKKASTTSLLVGELVTLYSELAEAKVFEKVKRLDELKKYIQQTIKDGAFDPALPVVLKSEAGEAEFGACSNTTVISDMSKVVEMLGLEVFKKLAKVNIGDLQKYLSGEEIASFSEKAYGSRSLKAVRKAS